MDKLDNLDGYLNDSAGWGKPVVLVNHEWWGVNQQIRSVADRLAREGFVTFVPDLYHGKVATDAQSAGRLMGELDWKRAEKDLQEAVDAAKKKAPGARVAVMGFCMGGAVTLMGAARVKGLSAAVVYYGIPDKVDLSACAIPVQGHFASQDEWCSPKKVDALEATLKKAGAPAELFRYDAQHAFANEKRPEVHHPEHARAAWERTVKFLHEKVG